MSLCRCALFGTPPPRRPGNPLRKKAISEQPLPVGVCQPVPKVPSRHLHYYAVRPGRSARARASRSIAPIPAERTGQHWERRPGPPPRTLPEHHSAGTPAALRDVARACTGSAPAGARYWCRRRQIDHCRIRSGSRRIDRMRQKAVGFARRSAQDTQATAHPFGRQQNRRHRITRYSRSTGRPRRVRLS